MAVLLVRLFFVAVFVFVAHRKVLETITGLEHLKKLFKGFVLIGKTKPATIACSITFTVRLYLTLHQNIGRKRAKPSKVVLTDSMFF